jgi:multidrug resistance efflux pump
MSPEKRFALWIRLAVVSFIILFVYFILADLFMPLTSQARVMRPVTQVAPELGGRVVDVNVANNAHVDIGDVLFRLDPEPLHIAVEKAELSLEQASRENDRLDAALAAARAQLAANQAEAEELAVERRRVEELVQSNSVSRQRRDQIVASARAAQAAMEAAESRVRELEVRRGEQGNDNLRLRHAQNTLSEAQLNLRRTTVHAEHAGVISNLQLQEGAYAQAGAPVMALVGETLDVAADFREKSLRHADIDDPVWVSFDALPGRIYTARVTSVDAGVREGQLLADGQLSTMPKTDRWVRDAQRLRVHVSLEDPPDVLPASGARATVQLRAGDNPLAGLFAWLQIRFVSLLHYVY